MYSRLLYYLLPLGKTKQIKIFSDDIDIAVDKVKSIIVSEQCRVDCENVELTVDKYKEEL